MTELLERAIENEKLKMENEKEDSPSQQEINSDMNPTQKQQEQYVVDANGTKTAVILSIEHYEQLLEDLHDLAIVAERRVEQPIRLAELKERLNHDGTL